MNIQRYHHMPTEQMMALLLTADPDKSEVLSYLRHSIILVCSDDQLCIGIAVLSTLKNTFELKNIAVADHHQGKGIAKQIIADVKRIAKELGAKRIEVGTGNSSLSQLALYQKCGFRMDHIEPDFFKPYPEPIYENGIRCLDKVWLSAEL